MFRRGVCIYILCGWVRSISSFVAPRHQAFPTSSHLRTSSRHNHNDLQTINTSKYHTFLRNNHGALEKRHTFLQASSSDATKSIDETIIPASIIVGTVTAAMGFLYGKALSLSVKTIWKTIPTLILKRYGSINPQYFITLVCTIGGLLMGILSSKLSSTFAVSDFVSAFSSVPTQTLPSSRIHLAPLLLLSLVTSTFGFSVGPEVCPYAMYIFCAL